MYNLQRRIFIPKGMSFNHNANSSSMAAKCWYTTVLRNNLKFHDLDNDHFKMRTNSQSIASPKLLSIFVVEESHKDGMKVWIDYLVSYN